MSKINISLLGFKVYHDPYLVLNNILEKILDFLKIVNFIVVVYLRIMKC